MKKIVCIVSGFLVFILLVFCVNMLKDQTASEQVDMDIVSSVDVAFSGWNGSAEPYITSNEIEYDHKNETLKKFVDSITYDFSKEKNVKNGDIIEIRAHYNEDLRKLANVNIVKKSKKITVSGLYGENQKYVTNEKGQEVQIVDGIEIPGGLTSSEKEAYLEYKKSLSKSSDEEDAVVANEWKKGESEQETFRTSTEFYIEDYNNDPIMTLYEAEYFGSTSSQMYKIENILKDQEVIGWRCRFKEESKNE